MEIYDCLSSKKQENSRKNIYFCFIDYAEASDCVDHNKLWKILKEMGIPDHLTYLLGNPYMYIYTSFLSGFDIFASNWEKVFGDKDEKYDNES